MSAVRTPASASRVPAGAGRSAASLRSLLWCVAALLGSVLIQVDRMPLWVPATACLCSAWSVAARARRVRLPGRAVKGAIAIALIGAVVAMLRTLNGLEAGSTLLAAMGSVKLLEAYTRRDRYIVIGAALFLLLAACLSRQSLPYAPLYAAQLWVCCSALVVVAHPESSLGGRAAALLAARSLLAALPLAVLAFLFFPRLSGSLWSLPGAGAATTGLADTLAPGAISDLSESSDPAFRAWFDGPPPPPDERYWRGPVLHDFDGYTWSRPPPWWFGSIGPTDSTDAGGSIGPSGATGPGATGPAAATASDGSISPAGPTAPTSHTYRYRVTLEPSSRRWWLALDTVIAPPSGPVRLTPDRVLVGMRPVTEPISYAAVSDTSVRDPDPPAARVLRRDLQLPPQRNPRSVELGRRLRRAAGSDAAFVRSVLELFRTGGFRYTLNPPPLGLDSVDDFLFGARRGFCGHFASAFVTLMRAGGVPARVVTGYLGGEWNPIGGYLLVRESDAHAWAEVWLQDRGWTRVDPTGVVAPERLTRGIDEFLPGAVSAPERLLLDVRWIASIRQAWDAANAWWTNEVVGFNLRAQLSLLRRLGVAAPRPAQLGWALALCLIGWLAVMTWQLGRSPRPPRPDRLARAYRRLCLKLARAGVPRAPHQGPLAYADSIARHRPDLAPTARLLLAGYAELRFGPERRDLTEAPAGAAGASRLADFERAIARWRIPRRRHAPRRRLKAPRPRSARGSR